MSLEYVTYEKKGKTAVLTLNRPDKHNALNEPLLTDFDAALKAAEEDTEIGVVVIKGAGKSFCAGYDLNGDETSDPAYDWRNKPMMHDLYTRQARRQDRIENLAKFPKPTIAQIQGQCLEGGCSIMMACDFAYAVEDAIFGDPSVRMGMCTDLPLWYYLIGIKRAKELLLTGRTIDAQEAQRIGMISKAVSANEIEAEVEKMVQVLLASPTDSLRNNREAFHAALDSRGLSAGFRFAKDMRVFSVLQRPGSRPREFNFFETRDQKGFKAACEEMNAPFKKIGY
ncbi:MAG: enoyl-CoA hydratase/isomerase family protein [Desulfobacterium sp.]|nr:enoyl-CoA hydratase/isomerase family protein [Desulfobacteraceae bacterium]MBA3037425.1 enoyl-CoA hydratase/isomerase family protein [Desulfobacterium sp.]